MSGKFIALIVAASIAVTGMTAAPARADNNDLVKALAAVAAVAVIGTAIHENKKSKRRKAEAVARQQHYTHRQPHRGHAHANRHHPNKQAKRRAANQRAYDRGYHDHQRQVQQRRAQRHHQGYGQDRYSARRQYNAR